MTHRGSCPNVCAPQACYIIKRKDRKKLEDCIICSHDRVRVNCYGVVDSDGFYSDIMHSAAIFPSDKVAMFNSKEGVICDSDQVSEFKRLTNSILINLIMILIKLFIL